jgi:hypothetical protein
MIGETRGRLMPAMGLFTRTGLPLKLDRKRKGQ